MDVAVELIIETMSQATMLLSVFLFFVVVAVIIFGCLIYLVEEGTFTINENYPNGAYLIKSTDGSSTVVSPFSSIPIGIYWAISTATGSG